jgi:hypothetical protein
LAARIQNDENSVPRATIKAATKCAHGGTSFRPNIGDFHRPLKVDCALYGMLSTREFHHNTIANVFDDPAPMLDHEWLKDFLSARL